MVEPQHERLRDAFLGWQCRIREYAVRRAEGRPSAGMRPTLTIDQQKTLGAITTVLNKLEPETATTEFRHLVKKTHDPRLRYESALKKLQVSYFQQPKTFSDGLTALFPKESSVAAALTRARHCELAYAQANQRFEMPVSIRQLDSEDPFFAATFWHNALFNPNLSVESIVLQFVPDWSKASADPTPFA